MKKSWVDSANVPGCEFPLQNLPYGIFSTAKEPTRRAGVAIGSFVLDLAAIFGDEFRIGALNPFIARGPQEWKSVRERLTALLAANAPRRDDALVPLPEARLHLPLEIPGYTDFYSSKEHATNVGTLFRDPKNALSPNWLEMPIAYNGRASSVVVSGTPVRRPNGQLKTAERPVLAPTRKLDFELEMAFVIGVPNVLGEPIRCEDAERHIFGMMLLNDWSARDIQAWEYVPLGPFNAKTFATTVSPWIVPLAALEPFRVAQPQQAPPPLPYLQHAGDHAFDIPLTAAVNGTVVSRSNFRYLYWSMAQQLAHHTVSGCNVRVGDLMGSGTISGPAEDAYGSLLEMTRDGRAPVRLQGGEERTFLQDGDQVILRGACEGDGYRIGFGECEGRVLPAAG